MGPPHEPLVAVFAPGAQRTRSLSLDTMATLAPYGPKHVSDPIPKNPGSVALRTPPK